MADQRTVVYEIRIEEGQALEAYENVNLKLQQNKERRKDINKEIAANVAAIKQLSAEINTEVGATAEQNAELERLKAARTEINRRQAEAIIIDKGLSAQARELTNDLSGLTENNLRFRDKMADANLEAIKQSGIIEALEAAHKSLESQLADLNARFAAGEVSEQEYAEASERMSTALVRVQGDMDAVGERTEELTADNDKLIKISADLEAQLKEVAQQYASGAITAGEYAQRTDELGGKLSITKQRIEENGRGIASEIGTRALNSLKDFAVGIGAAFAVDRLIQWGNELRERGIEIEQVTARAKVLFGEGFDEINAKARENGEAIGLSSSQYLKLASSAADALGNVGFSQDQINKQSQQFVQFAADIEDFTAGEVKAAQAMDILTNAALGNTKGLKELNIPVKANTEELKKQADQIEASEGVTRAEAEAIANLNLAFSALTPKIEAFKQQESGADEAADRATARMAEQSDALATTLTPAFTQATNAIANYIGGLQGAADTSETAFGKIFSFLGAAVNDNLNLAGQIAGTQKKYLDETAQALAQGAEVQKRYADSAVGLRERIAVVAEQQRAAIENGDATAAQAAQAELGTLRERLQVRVDEIVQTARATEAKQAEGQSIDQLRQKLQALQEARTGISTTDTGALDANAKQQEALERQIKAADAIGRTNEKAVKSEQDKAEKLREIGEGIATSRADLDARIADARVDNTARDEQELQKIRDKYAKQLEAARGYADQLKQIESLRDEEIAFVANEQAVRRVQEQDAFEAQVTESTLRGKEAAVTAEEQRWAAIIDTTRQGAVAAGLTRTQVEDAVLKQEAEAAKALLPQRLALLDEQAEAQRLAVVQQYEELYSTTAGNEERNIELARNAGTEIAAIDAENAAAKVRLTTETNAAIQSSNESNREKERASIEATGQSIASLLNTFQGFTDAGFDADIAEVSKQQAALQEQLNNTTNEPEKARIKERIEGLEKEKKALEDRKKSEKGFAVAAALISTYLAAQQVFANPSFPDPISKGIAAAATIAAGLLNVAKMQGFDKSGRVRPSKLLTSDDGDPIARDNGDNLLVTAQVGEMFVNRAHQRKAEELYGKDVWARIGIPGFASSGKVREFNVEGLPGFADSGIVDLFTPQPSSVAITQVIQAGAASALSERPIYVDVREVTDAQERTAQIREMSEA